MEMFGLSNRKVEDCFENGNYIADDIDYQAVDVKRKAYIKESEAFILGALEEAKRVVDGE